VIPLDDTVSIRLWTCRADREAANTCFWHGLANVRKPSIPCSVTDLLKLIPAEIETDFDVDERPSRHAA
jgi:hypothetical protein